MPLTAAQSRAQLADTARNPRRTVKGGEVVNVQLTFENRQFAAEELFDALAAHYGSANSYTTVLAGANNDLVFTARENGGPDITIRYLVAGNNTPLTVSVAGTAITVNVATDAGGLATSTATQVRDAVNSHSAASNLVFATYSGADTGAGVVVALAAQTLTGGDAKVTLDSDTAGQRQFRFRVK